MARSRPQYQYDTYHLRVDVKIPEDLKDRNGMLIAPAGIILDNDQLQRIQQRCGFAYYSDQPWPEDYFSATAPAASAETTDFWSTLDDELSSPPAAVEPEPLLKSLSTDYLRIGMRLNQNLYDDRGILLLAANTTISPRFMDLLHQRSQKQVMIRLDEPSASAQYFKGINTQLTRRLDALSSHIQEVPTTQSSPPWTRRGHLPAADLTAAAHAESAKISAAADALEACTQELLLGSLESVETALPSLHGFLDSLSMDMDLMPHLLALRRSPVEYLYDHCLNVSLLSMTLAAQMGFNRAQAYQVGVAGLLSDIGMLKLDDRIRLAPRSLTRDELLQVQYHPIHTLNLIEHDRSLDQTIMLAAYQAHERCDRSGYPRSRSVHTIHPYSRLIALADVYCAMVSPRPYRDPYPPYQAIEAILGQTKFGSFDVRSIRALLSCLSLYPVGSIVQLNDESIGRVIRANAQQYGRPMLTMLDEQMQESGEIVDLVECASLKVIRVLS
ncbi:MAG: hypothetical protein HJJLKODD_00283 [Phycisphaerae bacterium]|nr:hypothetical protein [Phycisphaerae bacterium]